jgi:hypothetical protein
VDYKKKKITLEEEITAKSNLKAGDICNDLFSWLFCQYGVIISPLTGQQLIASQ